MLEPVQPVQSVEPVEPQSLKKLSLKSLKRALDIFAPVHGDRISAVPEGYMFLTDSLEISLLLILRISLVLH